MNKTLKNILQFLLFLSIGAGILYLVYRHQNAAFLADCALRGAPESECDLMGKLLDDFREANFGWIALVMVAFLVSNFSRSAKWLILMAPLGYRPRFINAFLSILVGYFANLGLPRMGEVVRAGVLSRYEHIAAEKVLGTIVVDRLVDMACMALAFGLAFYFESEKLWGYLRNTLASNPNGDAGWAKWAIITGVFLLLAGLIYRFRDRLRQTVLFRKIAHLLAGFYEGLMTIRKLHKPGWFVFHSLNIWAMYFAMTWLGFKAFAPTEHLGFSAALTVFVFGTLGMVIPSPGGMGTFHALVIAALTVFYHIRGDDAFSAANIIFFSVSIGFNVALGLLSLLLLPIINRKYFPPSQLNH